ncbi:hypothetical protein [Hafnia phage Pocis76]|uniref:Uncharacterized protein n=1 Tax=Hafnia phage Pocis76 TaxID=2831174 RepID=A0A8E7FN90_9CAUD|nr:hypothetical protein [Hafnia phage Pocis76]
MKIETGKQAVWQHAKECGMDEKIALIAKYFDIKDVSIIGNGKMTYVDERPRKTHRVPAIPISEGLTTEGIIEEARKEKKHYK